MMFLMFLYIIYFVFFFSSYFSFSRLNKENFLKTVNILSLILNLSPRNIKLFPLEMTDEYIAVYTSHQQNKEQRRLANPNTKSNDTLDMFGNVI